MAMKPFCGYHFGDYFAHWLSFEKPGVKLPKVFHVNWFRKGDDGKFLWPGFGDNMRVLEWILGRCDGSAAAVETPIGRIPAKDALRQDDLAINETQLRALLHIDNDAWRDEFHDIGAFLQELGDRVPVALEVERQRILARLKR
jgi:phosphoenolpyruvate carboxykinase (GTP)